jgi:hypothetical protein
LHQDKDACGFWWPEIFLRLTTSSSKRYMILVFTPSVNSIFIRFLLVSWQLIYSWNGRVEINFTLYGMNLWVRLSLKRIRQKENSYDESAIGFARTA